MSDFDVVPLSEGLPDLPRVGVGVDVHPFASDGRSLALACVHWDGETGLYSQRRWDNDPYTEDACRAYDPKTGRYLLRAGVPVGFSSGYTFGSDNPWSSMKVRSKHFFAAAETNLLQVKG